MTSIGKGFTFTWEIENFSMLPHQRGESLTSETFVVEKMEYYLKIYPRVLTASDGGYIALYLRSTEKCLETKVTSSLTFVSTEPSSEKLLLLENSVISEGWGSTKLMSRSGIYAKKQLYLPNDTLTLRCCIKPADERSEETIVLTELETVPSLLTTCNSRTTIQVNRRSITLPVRNIKELRKRSNNASFLLESALKKSVGLQITLNFTKLTNENFVKIEIRQTNLPLRKKRLFVKCKMTVIAAYKKYQDSNESTHLFKSDLDDVWHFPEFLLTSNLTSDKYLYLDDTLLLQCDFAFSCKSAVYRLETNYTPFIFETKEDRSVSELVTKLEDLYASGKFCDVELRAGKETFPAYKLVLCALSPVFRAMFENDSKERVSNVVEIEDVDPDTLRRMLAFIHSDVLEEDLSFENECKLFSAADKYDLDTLRRRCSILLVSPLSVENVCDAQWSESQI